MNTPSRKHHFLPQAYLAAFTDNGAKSGRLFVFDVQNNNSFVTKPEKVAAERDFNRIDFSGLPIDALENDLARFETDLAKSLRRIRDFNSYPDKTDLDFLINFIALIAVRNPQSRRRSGQAFQQMRQTFWGALLSDKELFESHVNAAKMQGQAFDMTFEETRAYMRENSAAVIQFTSQDHTEIELDVFDDILQLFGNRHWSLVVNPAGNPEFVSSDYPIGFHFKAPAQGIRFVGYGIPKTEIFFPIGPHHGVVGVFEEPYPQVVNATVEQVATFNSYVVASADKQIFSRREKFSSLLDGRIVEIDCRPKN